VVSSQLAWATKASAAVVAADKKRESVISAVAARRGNPLAK
jgi:hypothetical protein